MQTYGVPTERVIEWALEANWAAATKIIRKRFDEYDRLSTRLDWQVNLPERMNRLNQTLEETDLTMSFGMYCQNVIIKSDTVFKIDTNYRLNQLRNYTYGSKLEMVEVADKQIFDKYISMNWSYCPIHKPAMIEAVTGFISKEEISHEV